MPKMNVDEVEFSADATEDTEKAEAAVEAQRRDLATADSKLPRLHVGTPAYKQFSDEMLALVAKTVMPEGYTLPELYMGLEVAATYGLDPFTKEIWFVRMKQGSPVVPMVGRDGLLAVAERHKDFVGFRNMEVYENDTFVYEADPIQRADGTWTHVRHSFDVTNDRGKLRGAYAEVYRKGRPPVFFWAELSEYDRSDGTYSPWKKQKTAMIRKCALANALRLAYRISGLYIADEQSGTSLEIPVQSQVEEPEGEAELAWPDDLELAAYLKELFDAADYTHAKRKLVLISAMGERDAYERLVEQVEAELAEQGKEIPERPAWEGEVVDEGGEGSVENAAAAVEETQT